MTVEHTHQHTHQHDHGHDQQAHGEGSNAWHWDERYRQSDRIWSGQPNRVLVEEAEGLVPGRALDLGCGEGADAVWLATKGWKVTATDLSAVAIERASGHAADAGVTVDFQRHDLDASFPDGEFDLITAMFFHSFVDLKREDILRRAAAALAPGGRLLIVSHAGFPDWHEGERPDVSFPTPDETVAELHLSADYEVLKAEEHAKEVFRPDGQRGVRHDSTVLVRRLSA
ncbi:class I SAM-dependent methyltransferase [Actinocorallia sp. A-T 12471]|uniref:class I SAM-dependent methyltransferase n=1 Tax=Actinocorallia sp. A-T 12471 TaxID=3089813 RepID=UPI0029CCA25C|nr:methyltransferase domain-containing protein [Actinocorallia sp. A-T 12471]MDX6740361.1 methyltransferase domain-containing protein [Actinocorallia sp. A-T 12471]